LLLLALHFINCCCRPFISHCCCWHFILSIAVAGPSFVIAVAGPSFVIAVAGPSISNAGDICEEVLGDIRPYAIMYDEVKELYNILRYRIVGFHMAAVPVCSGAAIF
jgi:hypothetical protein